MTKINGLFCGFLAVFAISVQAASVVEEGRGEFKFVQVSAEDVAKVEVTFSQEIVRDDCNGRTLNLHANKPVFAGGNEVNWHKMLFVNTFVMATELYCPIPEPVTETIYSEAFIYESYENDYINNEVKLQFIVPAHISVDAVSIR